MSTVEEKLIPRVFWPSLDANPTDLTLRRAVADYMMEQGDEIGSECIRWSAEKCRSPTKEGWWISEEGPTDGCEKLAVIPKRLFDVSDGRVPPSGVVIYAAQVGYVDFQRLVWRWSLCTPEQRTQFWSWEPPKEE